MAANLNVPVVEEGTAPIRPQTAFEQQFRRQQSDLAALLRSSAFPRTIYILVFLMWLTLLKTPNIDGGVPFPMNHEILISFAVVSVVGILLNLFVFFMQILGFINQIKSNKTEPAPSTELIEKWFHTQKKLIIAIHIAETVNILGLGFFCWGAWNFSQRRQQFTGMN